MNPALTLAVLDGDVVESRQRVLRAARGVVRHDGARHSVMTLKHALERFDRALGAAHQARKDQRA